ncbi:MAG: hypothetical protein RL115_608 [Bacteroidota bacterium]|jgi:hypothetical protein
MKLKPLVKGAITGALMIAVILWMYYTGKEADKIAQYTNFGIYALGIAWAIIDWSKSIRYTGKFGDAFQTGFKCFIVATLLMIAFTAIFNKMHPEFAEASSKMLREALISKKELPTEIDLQVERYKNNYTIMVVYTSIFGYLIVGAAVAAVTSLLISRRKP